MWLFLLFVAVPVAEIALFIQVGGAIGLWPTVAIVLATAAAGAALVRRQGLSVLARAQSELRAGLVPAGELAHGGMLLVAGLLLLTPGFLTDTLGFLLLVPALRRALMRRIRLQVAVHRGTGGRVVEGEWEEASPRPGPPPGRPRLDR